jgi:hypothetical protein
MSGFVSHVWCVCVWGPSFYFCFLREEMRKRTTQSTNKSYQDTNANHTHYFTPSFVMLSLYCLSYVSVRLEPLVALKHHFRASLHPSDIDRLRQTTSVHVFCEASSLSKRLSRIESECWSNSRWVFSFIHSCPREKEISWFNLVFLSFLLLWFRVHESELYRQIVFQSLYPLVFLMVYNVQRSLFSRSLYMHLLQMILFVILQRSLLSGYLSLSVTLVFLLREELPSIPLPLWSRLNTV